MSQQVNHPQHYNMSPIEVIDAIEAWKLGFNLGNTVKYIVRATHKDDATENLEKAWWYLTRELLSKYCINEADLKAMLETVMKKK